MAQQQATQASTAAYRVLHTAELLEMILLAVFEREFEGEIEGQTIITSAKLVLLGQRVDRFFRQTVQGSAKLLGAINQLAVCGLPENTTWIHGMLFEEHFLSCGMKRMPFRGLNHILGVGTTLGVDAIICKDDLVFLAKDKGSWRHMQVLVRSEAEMGETMLCQVGFTCTECEWEPAETWYDIDISKETTAGELADTVVRQLKQKHGACLDNIREAKHAAAL